MSLRTLSFPIRIPSISFRFSRSAEITSTDFLTPDTIASILLIRVRLAPSPSIDRKYASTTSFNPTLSLRILPIYTITPEI
jgi:hypothetical protein